MSVDYGIWRYRIEDSEHWQEWANLIPSLRFDSDWDVKVIPPFAGAIIRFVVYKGDRSVSVYFDAYSKLGWMYDENDEPIPYWEVYTSSIDDKDNSYPHRYLLGEEEDLMKDIRRILND